MLGKQIHDEELLNDYLLSGVNSLYKLNSKYLEITQPINSIEEIPNTISNYIVICRSYPSDFDDGVSLTPANKSGLFVYYFN